MRPSVANKHLADFRQGGPSQEPEGCLVLPERKATIAPSATLFNDVAPNNMGNAGSRKAPQR